MADYLPLKAPGQDFTLTTSGAVTGGQLVRISGSGTVAATTAASADAIGVAAFDAASGATVTVYSGGVHVLTASGAITAGANVEGAAAGAVAAHTNGTADVNIVGRAITTASGGKVTVKLLLG